MLTSNTAKLCDDKKHNRERRKSHSQKKLDCVETSITRLAEGKILRRLYSDINTHLVSFFAKVLDNLGSALAVLIRKGLGTATWFNVNPERLISHLSI